MITALMRVMSVGIYDGAVCGTVDGVLMLWVYVTGVTEGFASDLLVAISDTSFWTTSDSSTFDPSITVTSFTVLSTSTEPSGAPSPESLAPHDESANDDDRGVVVMSVLIMVGVMTAVFLGCCCYTMRNKRLETLVNSRGRKSHYGSSLAGKVSLLDFGGQSLSEIPKPMEKRGEDSSDI